MIFGGFLGTFLIVVNTVSCGFWGDFFEVFKGFGRFQGRKRKSHAETHPAI